MDEEQRGQMEAAVDHHLINAREGLLDAVEALESHSGAVILVGAQAVYVHTETDSTSFSVSPFTYDTDIVLDPSLLGIEPTIIDAMGGAGFSLTDQPGLYRQEGGAQVDLLVPEAVGGPGRRGARLGYHGNRAAMKVYGLEGALVSHASRRIRSLIPSGNRSCVIEVAGPAALLVAKVHKIAERVDEPSRWGSLDKDAFDIFRLLRAIDARVMASDLNLLRSQVISREVTIKALSIFEKLFCTQSGTGTELVVQHVTGLENSDFIAASSVALSQDLLDEIPSEDHSN